MDPLPTSGSSGFFDTSNFRRAIREMCRYKPHLSAATGSESLRRKKLTGEKRISYEEAVGFLRNARAEGERRGLGAESVALLLNEIVRDTLPPGAALDVIARPVEADPVPATCKDTEMLLFAVETSALVTYVEEAIADGHIEHREAQQLEHKALSVKRRARRLVLATRAMAVPR